MKTSEDFKAIVTSRAKRCLKKSFPVLNSGKYFLGGGCLANTEFNDIDIFPVGDETFTVPTEHIEIICTTKNATTIKKNNVILQFCNYKHSTLEQLVNSFDFAHIQVGCLIEDGEVKDVYWTDNFEAAKVCQTSEFVGSNYPLSSLVRLQKYVKRDQLTKGSSIRAALYILIAIIERGFTDYEDFKDQLDAVDLGLVPEDIKEVERTDLYKLYELLKRV